MTIAVLALSTPQVQNHGGSESPPESSAGFCHSPTPLGCQVLFATWSDPRLLCQRAYCRFPQVARRTHPDKGGTTADTQALNAAREAWVAQTSLLRRPGPKTVAPSTALVVLEGWSANFPGKSLFRVRSVAVLLTYCTFLANNWLHFVGYVQSVRTDLFDEAVRTRTDVKEGRPYAIAVQEA